MSHLARLRRPAGAMGLSTLTVSLAVLLQASWFFRDDVVKVASRQATIRHLAVGNGGNWALASVITYPASDRGDCKQTLWLCNLAGHSRETRELHFDELPGEVACAADGNVGFVATEGGRIYAVDLQSEQPVAQCLGRHAGHYARSLVSSRDGSRLVVAAGSLAAWSYPAAALLWERTDLQATDCCFGPGEQRLYACLKDGSVLELNASTGSTQRCYDCATALVQKVAVSPDGAWLACMELDRDRQRGYRLLDVRTGETCWRVACAVPLQPQFVNGGELLLANLQTFPALSLVDSASGRKLVEHPLHGDLFGLTVVGPGAVYTWSGTELRRLDLRTGCSRPVARL